MARKTRRPSVVGVLKQKGGAGATTLTIHLAVAAIEAGMRALIVDTDPQRSASTWAHARGSDAGEILVEPPVVAVDVEQLSAVIDAAQADGYDLVVVDTPPHSSARTTAVARLADVAVIPTKTDALDLAAIPAMLEIVRAVGTTHTVVLNGCTYRSPEAAEARELLAQVEAPVWEGELGLRRAFARAIGHGKSVTELGADEKASAEIRELWAHVASLLANHK